MKGSEHVNILCDRHHSDLLYSLQRLFEDRLGINLYIPVGYDWWRQNIWRFGEVFGDDRLAQQYLNTGSYREVESGLFLTFDPCHPERPLYGVTLEKARSWTWDFILATVQENERGFHRFAQEVNAKYLYHVGNARQGIDWSLDPIILNSTSSPTIRSISGRDVYIGQEFDHLTTFRYRKPQRLDRITSFMNLLSKIPECLESFEGLRELLSFEFRMFGHECPDGFLKPVAAIAEEMARSGWAYHDKPTGDGFGHLIHNWAAVGRPLIGHGRYYQGQRAEIFWQDGLTCIDLDKHSISEAAEIIKSTSVSQHESMCEAIRDVFENAYDPARDALRVAKFLDISDSSSGRKDLTKDVGSCYTA